MDGRGAMAGLVNVQDNFLLPACFVHRITVPWSWLLVLQIGRPGRREDKHVDSK